MSLISSDPSTTLTRRGCQQKQTKQDANKVVSFSIILKNCMSSCLEKKAKRKKTDWIFSGLQQFSQGAVKPKIFSLTRERESKMLKIKKKLKAVFLFSYCSHAQLHSSEQFPQSFLLISSQRLNTGRFYIVVSFSHAHVLGLEKFKLFGNAS